MADSSGRVYEWRITNTTGGLVVFDDKSLASLGVVSVHRLTDDILAGWRGGSLLISPDPGGLIPGLVRITALDPCQLPLPVRIVGLPATSLGNVILDGAPVTLPVGVTTSLLPADRRRVLWRLRNTGAQPLWLGGATVNSTNGMIRLMPDEIYTERDAPGAQWYGHVPANLNALGTTVLVQQIYSGTV